MISVLLLGFLVGMQHALEVDHVAAVASLAARARTVGSVVRHGALWGLGHTNALHSVRRHDGPAHADEVKVSNAPGTMHSHQRAGFG